MPKQKDTHIAKDDQTPAKIRLDKWLWACRFYKTRALAKQAIEGGKVHYDGIKPKTGKIIKIADKIKLRQGFDEKTVIIVQLADIRKNATFAQTLYQETEESVIKRQEITQMRKLSAPATQGKPDKKQRRQIHRFKTGE
ncbi:MAG: RNA-binding protein [Kangiella sp.]|nr:MAG: RNA-binding protein [Kangiella sp.]